jgi:hypothetical protein
VLAAYQTKIFTGTELMQLWGEFKEFWRQEKSRQALEAARAKKGGQGRVKRPKSDLRFTANRRHKHGYCRNCGRRVRLGERLCDDCVSGKPLLTYFGEERILAAMAGDTGREKIVGRY